MTIRPALKHLLLNPSPASSSDAGEPDTRPDEERFPGLGAEPSFEDADEDPSPSADHDGAAAGEGEGEDLSSPGQADVGDEPSREVLGDTGERWSFQATLGKGESFTSQDPGEILDVARRHGGKTRISVRLDDPASDPPVVHFPALDLLEGGELRPVKARRETWRQRARELAASLDELVKDADQ